MKIDITQIKDMETFRQLVEKVVTEVVVSKFNTNIGNGIAKKFTINHNLTSRNLTFSIRESGGEGRFIQPSSFKVVNDNLVIIEFDHIPPVNGYVLTLVG